MYIVLLIACNILNWGLNTLVSGSMIFFQFWHCYDSLFFAFIILTTKTDLCRDKSSFICNHSYVKNELDTTSIRSFMHVSITIVCK